MAVNLDRVANINFIEKEHVPLYWTIRWDGIEKSIQTSLFLLFKIKSFVVTTTNFMYKDHVSLAWNVQYLFVYYIRDAI